MPDKVYQGLPFEEAIAFFKGKVKIPTSRWNDLWQGMHARGFMVAGACTDDVLTGFYAAIEKAIAQGTTLADFQKDFDSIVKKTGWTYNGTRGWRSKLIFETNLQSAYQAGRHAQMTDPDVLERRPYWMYRHGDSRNPRPQHLAWDGLVLPADDPWWQAHYPPCGWNCFPLGTCVYTPSGLLPIESIQEHDWVIGGSGDEKRVTAIHRNPFDGNLVRLTLEGVSVSMTPNHRVLTMNGWVRADALNAGDILVETLIKSTVNSVISDKNMADAQIRNGAMSLPTQGESSETITADSEIQFGDERIYPTRPDIGVDNVIVNGIKTKHGKVTQHNLFGAGWWHLARGMCRWISTHHQTVRRSVFAPYFRSSRGRGIMQLFRHLSDGCVRFFGFSKPGMASLVLQFINKRKHGFTRMFSPAGGRMYPLSLYRITSPPGGNPIMTQEFGQGAAIDVPSHAQSTIGKQFHNIQIDKRITNGAPLDGFDTLYNFRAWARSHCLLRKVMDIQDVPYTGIVYNLSVSQDESFIVPGATVHNCKCTAFALSDDELKSLGKTGPDDAPETHPYTWTDKKTGREYPVADKGIDPGWDYNVGEAAHGRTQALRLMDDTGPWTDLYARGPADYGRPDKLVPVPSAIRPGKQAHDEASLRALLREAIGGDVAHYTDPTKTVLEVNQGICDHIMKKPETRLDGREGWFSFIPELIEDPYEIWVGFAKSELSGRVSIRRRYVKAIKSGDKKVIGLWADFVDGQWASGDFFRGGLTGAGNLRKGRMVYGKD